MNESIIKQDEIVNKEYYEGIKDIITCLICLDIVSDPVQCDKCQHCFCSKCIQKCMKCPLRCNNSIFTPAFLCKKLMSEIEIKCNCGEKLKYDNILKHKAEECKSIDLEKKNELKKKWELEKQKLENNKKELVIPNLKLLRRGSRIDDNAYNVITHEAYEAMKAKEDPLSSGILKRIKNKIQGEWMVFAHIYGLRGYDFMITNAKFINSVDFLIGNFQFQI
jgi:hypothetical protein